MKLNTNLTQLCTILLLTISMVTIVFASNESFSLSLPGCKNTCGDVKIPFPFGISDSSIPNQGPCFLEPKFNLTCKNNTKLFSGELQVSNISVVEGQVEVWFFVSSYCGSEDTTHPFLNSTFGVSISPRENKFLTVGCNSIGFLTSIYGKDTFYTGCLTLCDGTRNKIENGTCSGIGCCQVDIPPMMRNITIDSLNILNSTEFLGLGCSHSFVVKNGFYKFNVSHLDNFPYKMLPLILDWSVGSKDCSASKIEDGYACKNNSVCDDKDIDFGYRCKCKDRYEGNPYHPDGCKGNFLRLLLNINLFM